MNRLHNIRRDDRGVHLNAVVALIYLCDVAIRQWEPSLLEMPPYCLCREQEVTDVVAS